MIRFSGLDVITELNEITKESNGFKEIRPEIIIPKKISSVKTSKK